MDQASGKELERGGWAAALLTLAGTSDDPPLIFADEFVEILKEADEDDEQRAGEADQEEHGQQIHRGTGQGKHTRILNQRGGHAGEERASKTPW